MVEVKHSEEIINYLRLKRNTIYRDILAFRFNEVGLTCGGNSDEHFKDFFEIVITQKDSGKLMIRNKTYSDLDSSICFVSPRQPVNYINSDNHHNDEGICILFKASLFHPIRQNFNICNDFPFFKIHASPLFKLNPEQLKLLYPLFEKLHLETLKEDIGSLQIIRSYLEIILNSCLRAMNQNVEMLSASRQEIVAFEFEELVATHRPDLKSLNDYANTLNISSAYLSECIKKTTGKTAKQIMVDYQIVKAQTMLNMMDTPVYNIAHELGFDEVTNFSKFFKKYTGKTPSQFRKKPVAND